ncbi:hypothetical protein JTB14_004326 [Gonioctena quinquepunctata]|nr:hypothetical protein JTB14_004326 [Gonioctena quinquepunctata]
MGTTFSCIGREPSVERIQYDLSPIHNKNLPIIWMTGQQNTGKKTHGNFMEEKYNFEILHVTELLRKEANKDTKRGGLIKDALTVNKNVDDRIVLDLLKEALLDSQTDKGFVISNFPKNSKQADLFLKEVGYVTFIFYLYSDTSFLIERAQKKSVGEVDEDMLRRSIASSTRDIKMNLGKYIMKIESINTSGRPEEVFPKVESALIRRINMDRPIITETDYVRPQKEADIELEMESDADRKSHNQFELEQVQLHDKEQKEENIEECSMVSELDSI